MAELTGLIEDPTKTTEAETNVPCSASNTSNITITTIANLSGSSNSPRYVENQIDHEHMPVSIDTPSSLCKEEDFSTYLQLDKNFQFPEFHSEDWDLHMFNSVNPPMEISFQCDHSTHGVFSPQTQNLEHANAPMLVDSVTTDLCRVSIQHSSLEPLHVESLGSEGPSQSGNYPSMEQENQENPAAIKLLPMETNKTIREDSKINVEASLVDMACSIKNDNVKEKRNDASNDTGVDVSITKSSTDCKMESVYTVATTESGDEDSDDDEDEDETSEESETSSASTSSESSSSSEEEEEEEDDDDTSSLEDIVQQKRPAMDIESECEEGELKMSPSRGKRDVKKKGSAAADEGSSEDDAELIESKNMNNLPPVPNISVTLEPHHNTIPVGAVSSIMGFQVIIEGIEDQTPLGEGSILWITEQRLPLGIIDEIFGPVKKPFYIVRYNKTEDIPNGVTVGVHVSFVQEFADFVLNNPDLYSKGYDGLEEDLSDSEVEFSDDEKEAEYKRSKVSMKRNASVRNVVENETEWNSEMTNNGNLSKKSLRNAKKRENRKKKFQESRHMANQNSNSRLQHMFDHSPVSSEMSSHSDDHWHTERSGKGCFTIQGQNDSRRRDNNDDFRQARSRNSRFHQQQEGNTYSRTQGMTDHRRGPGEHEWSSRSSANRSPDSIFDQGVQGPTSVNQVVIQSQHHAKMQTSGNLQLKDASSPVQNYCQLPNIATVVPAVNLAAQQCGVNSAQGWPAIHNAYPSGSYQPAGYQPAPGFCQFPPAQQVPVQTNFSGYAQSVQPMPLNAPVVGIPAQPMAYNQGFGPHGPTSSHSMMWNMGANAAPSQLPSGNTDTIWQHNPAQPQQVTENRQQQHYGRQISPNLFKNRNSTHQRRRF